MRRTDEGTESLFAYYRTAEVADKYLSAGVDGLTELEQEVTNRYFTESGASVLDLGCGGGRTATELVQMGYEVIGIDFMELYVEHARTVVPGAKFSVGDATSLPFKDETFQYVLFSYNGMDDIKPEEKRYKALREVHRVLKPGGVFAFSSHNLWSTYVVRSFDLEGVRNYIDFWVQNLCNGRLFSRYKLDNSIKNGPRRIYYIRPSDQRQQLRNCGFDVLEVLRTDGLLEPYFNHPYYVAQKPESPRT